jgi:hypothetical protein
VILDTEEMVSAVLPRSTRNRERGTVREERKRQFKGKWQSEELSSHTEDCTQLPGENIRIDGGGFEIAVSSDCNANSDNDTQCFGSSDGHDTGSDGSWFWTNLWTFQVKAIKVFEVIGSIVLHKSANIFRVLMTKNVSNENLSKRQKYTVNPAGLPFCPIFQTEISLIPVSQTTCAQHEDEKP